MEPGVEPSEFGGFSIDPSPFAEPAPEGINAVIFRSGSIDPFTLYKEVLYLETVSFEKLPLILWSGQKVQHRHAKPKLNASLNLQL